MNALDTEFHRLYLVDDPTAVAPSLMTVDGRVRAMVLELARPAEWLVVSTVWQGVQSDLNLPAPAIAVTGNDGYQLWFSLAEPVTAAEASFFLESLRQRYLGKLLRERISMWPTETRHAQLLPALQPGTGLWSAFVAPDLAAIFADSPGLDVSPRVEAQAKILAPLESIKPAVFEAIFDRVISDAERSSAGNPTGNPPGQSIVPTAPQVAHTDAKRFLTEVMGDPRVDMHLRIEAAKALLPYA
ncbi:MAG: hypothetical protein CFE44_07860 [Burkholderiales bacterium PBB4]|nr:MAG: hypothetical protein CFE44_07860 [Burkholderiales bacterium PBB4]